MKQIKASATSAGVTPYICLNRRGGAGDSYLVIIDMKEGSGTVDFEFTPDNCEEVEDNFWIQHHVLKDVTEYSTWHCSRNKCYTAYR